VVGAAGVGERRGGASVYRAATAAVERTVSSGSVFNFFFNRAPHSQPTLKESVVTAAFVLV
jgi:hypothetical protein